MTRRRPRGLLALLVVTTGALTGCLGPRSCTEVGGTNTVQIRASPAVRAPMTSLRLQLCQDRRCHVQSFSAVSANRYGVSIERGISVGDPGFVVNLSRLGGRPDPDQPATLTLDVAGAQGMRLLHRVETFRFARSYPNGRKCAPTVLTHTTTVRAGDLGS